jgi:hypothetical protein
MINLRRVSIVVLAAVLLVTPRAAPSAHAGDTRCAGTLTGPVPGNVSVPEGQTCLLLGAEIEGNLFVGAGAELRDDATGSAPNIVRGNLRAEGGDLGGLENTRVFGDAANLTATRIDLKAVVVIPPEGGALRQFRVDGNLMIEEATDVVVDGASVGRNLRVIKSRGPGFVTIRGVNRVGEFGRMGGNVVVKDSVTRQIFVDQNSLQGNVDVRGNVTTSFGVVVTLNDALGNISIVDNESRVNPLDPVKDGLRVEDNQTGGNLNLIDNVMEAGSFITSNEVDGNMAVIRTLGTGAKTVTLNTVAGTLRCVENDPPFVGAPNIAGGRQGQCS